MNPLILYDLCLLFPVLGGQESFFTSQMVMLDPASIYILHITDG